LVTGTPVTSDTNPVLGSVVIATATCADGKVLLGGGAEVTTNALVKSSAVLQSSFPSSATTWTAKGVVNGIIIGGKTITVKAYAICSL
jgi:hypothetical protein